MLKQVMHSAMSLARDVVPMNQFAGSKLGYAFHWSAFWQLFGKTHTHWKEAERDFLLLLRYQEDNGRIPNFISPVAKGPGLIAPPLPAIVLYHLYEFAPDKSRALAFVKNVFPSIVDFHRYLYTFRDPLDDGLPFIWHPAESGFLPQDFLASADTPKENSLAFNWQEILESGSKYKLETGELYRHHSFLVQDPMFLSLLTWSNECLIKLGGLIRTDLSEILTWHELTTYSINEKLWQSADRKYAAFDLRSEKPLALHSIRAFMPLVGEIPTQEQAELILKLLESEDFGGRSHDHYLCPSRALSHTGADGLLEGKSSVQLDFNWMIIRGLLRYDFEEMAMKMEQDSLDLVLHSGFWEGYDPLRYDAGPRGMGHHNSSKTASLILDMLIRRKGMAILY